VRQPLRAIRRLGCTLKQRAADVLAFFDRPGTSNGPTEAFNGRLEHLRGSALGFRNLTNYIARSLLETGGFRPTYTLKCDEPQNRAKSGSSNIYTKFMHETHYRVQKNMIQRVLGRLKISPNYLHWRPLSATRRNTVRKGIQVRPEVPTRAIDRLTQCAIEPRLCRDLHAIQICDVIDPVASGAAIRGKPRILNNVQPGILIVHRPLKPFTLLQSRA
jgi:hypothetical protein